MPASFCAVLERRDLGLGMNAELYNAFDGGLSAIAERYGLPEPVERTPSRERVNPHVRIVPRTE
jgi:hypothetical protein